MAAPGGEVVLCVGISDEQVCGYCAMCISCKVGKGTAYRHDHSTSLT